MFYKQFIVKPVQRASYFDTEKNVIQKWQIQGGKRVLLESKPIGSVKRVNTQTGESLTDTIRPILNRSNNLYDIGLSELVDNFVYEKDVEEVISRYNLDPAQWREHLKRIVQSPKVTKQVWGEIRFGLNYDELTQRRPPKATKENPDPRTRIMKTKVVLYDEAQPFSEDNLEGWLKIHILRSRTDVVVTDVRKVNPAVHRWLMLEQSVEQRQTLDVTNLQNQAIAKYAMLNERYPVTNALEENVIYFIGSLCYTREGKAILKGKQNIIAINEKMDTFLKPRDKSLIKGNCENFIGIVENFEKDADSFYAKFLARQAANTNVVQNNNGRWYWVSKMKEFKSVGISEFTSYQAFEAFVQSEMGLMDSPVFKDLIKEVEDKGGIVPSVLKEEINLPDFEEIKKSKKSK